MGKTVQVIVTMNDIDAHFLYDEDIKKIIKQYYEIMSDGKMIGGKLIKKVEISLHVPPLTIKERNK